MLLARQLVVFFFHLKENGLLSVFFLASTTCINPIEKRSHITFHWRLCTARFYALWRRPLYWGRLIRLVLNTWLCSTGLYNLSFLFIKKTLLVNMINHGSILSSLALSLSAFWADCMVRYLINLILSIVDSGSGFLNL